MSTDVYKPGKNLKSALVKFAKNDKQQEVLYEPHEPYQTIQQHEYPKHAPEKSFTAYEQTSKESKKTTFICIVAICFIFLSITLSVFLIYDKHTDNKTSESISTPPLPPTTTSISTSIQPTDDEPNDNQMSFIANVHKTGIEDPTEIDLSMYSDIRVVYWNFTTNDYVQQTQRFPIVGGLPEVSLYNLLEYGVCCTSHTQKFICTGFSTMGRGLFMESELDTDPDTGDVFLLLQVNSDELIGSACWIKCTKFV